MAPYFMASVLPIITASSSFQRNVEAVYSHAPSDHAFLANNVLYRDGCQYFDAGAHHWKNNCTEVCLQPGMIWSNPHTIHNCLSYTNIAQMLRGGAMIQTSHDNALALGFLADFDPSQIEIPMRECLVGFCREMGSEACVTEIKQGLATPMDAACKYMKSTPNPDVGGIGVNLPVRASVERYLTVDRSTLVTSCNCSYFFTSGCTAV
jgi:hypothetical protein